MKQDALMQHTSGNILVCSCGPTSLHGVNAHREREGERDRLGKVVRFNFSSLITRAIGEERRRGSLLPEERAASRSLAATNSRESDLQNQACLENPRSLSRRIEPANFNKASKVPPPLRPPSSNSTSPKSCSQPANPHYSLSPPSRPPPSLPK
ncbi:hypothetical protein BU16DRAFT_266120 [Lophium mytilinum]|uniref:Uncharacterized protein n=1 Tax=Lophium mytilinum TaxID=390894 RepID=A0A6A6R3H6_9PEZI|nr:hypothetical protein BU16DRAFT_266120 [Lophium mytilinum]